MGGPACGLVGEFLGEPVGGLLDGPIDGLLGNL